MEIKMPEIQDKVRWNKKEGKVTSFGRRETGEPLIFVVWDDPLETKVLILGIDIFEII